jgi:hypothetical protein
VAKKAACEVRSVTRAIIEGVGAKEILVMRANAKASAKCGRERESASAKLAETRHIERECGGRGRERQGAAVGPRKSYY